MIKILINLVFNNKKIKDLDGEIWIQEILLKEKFLYRLETIVSALNKGYFLLDIK